jgi:hypothetical protein
VRKPALEGCAQHQVVVMFEAVHEVCVRKRDAEKRGELPVKSSPVCSRIEKIENAFSKQASMRTDKSTCNLD